MEQTLSKFSESAQHMLEIVVSRLPAADAIAPHHF